MMRDQGARVMEYLHATLFFAMFVPLVYAVAQWSDPAGTGMLYLKCLMIAVPVIVTERAARRGRSVVLYVLISLLLLAGMGGVTGGSLSCQVRGEFLKVIRSVTVPYSSQRPFS